MGVLIGERGGGGGAGVSEGDGSGVGVDVAVGGAVGVAGGLMMVGSSMGVGVSVGVGVLSFSSMIRYVGPPMMQGGCGMADSGDTGGHRAPGRSSVYRPSAGSMICSVPICVISCACDATAGSETVAPAWVLAHRTRVVWLPRSRGTTV